MTDKKAMIFVRHNIGRDASRLGALLVPAALLASACGGGSGSYHLPPSTPFPPALEQRLHDIRDRMSRVRKLPVNSKAQEGTIAPEALRQHFDESAAGLSAKDRRDTQALTVAFRVLHLIGPDDDLLQDTTDFYASGISGMYAFDEDRLVLVAGDREMTRGEEVTLAHEYVHSFQDVAFNAEALGNLGDKEDQGKSATEYSTTVSCLEEGDASFGSVLYAQDAFGDNWRDALSSDDAPSDRPETPPALERFFMFDYDQCVTFVARLYLQGGWDAIDAAYKEPPWTTEQVLHPEKYTAREAVKRLARVELPKRLGGGWQQLTAGVFGEFDVYNYLLTLLDDEDAAAQAAAGWGAGWIGVYSEKKAKPGSDPNVLVHIGLEWDTPDDFAEFMLAYGRLVDKVADGGARFGGDEGPVCWETGGEYGYVAWDRERARMDIVITTSPEARSLATSDVLSGPVRRSCPA